MRMYTREQVEQAVADVCQGLMSLDGFRAPASDECRTGAREVLRRLDALPNTPALLERHEECDGTGGRDGRCRPCGGTGMVESNPPAAPENSWTSLSTNDVLRAGDETARASLLASRSEGWTAVSADDHGKTVTAALADDMDARERLFRRRPRATTPTPEVPALAQLGHAFVPGDATYGWERQCAHPAKDGLRHCGYPPEAHAQPEPATPEVVLDGGPWRVLVGGVLQTWNERREEWEKPRKDYAPVLEAMTGLARALAEANREQRIAQVKADASYAKGHEDGAESMRERVKSLIMAEQAKQEDGPLSDDNGHAFRLLLRLADAVGALSLEEP